MRNLACLFPGRVYFCQATQADTINIDSRRDLRAAGESLTDSTQYVPLKVFAKAPIHCIVCIALNALHTALDEINCLIS